MKKIYDFKSIDTKWKKIWLDKRFYAFDKVNFNNNIFSIVIPPPNITGRLHMGHAFQCVVMDFLIRYHKMKGFMVLWKAGCDHAGIATQILIEQKFSNLSKKGLYSSIVKWKKKSIKNIKKQMYDLGFLLNWDTFRFTLDKGFSYAVNSAFISLYNDGLIYRSTTLVNWDMSLQTAISDLEIIYKKEDSFLYYIKYFLCDSDKFLLIATTRPETIFADAAVAVNPKDEKYKNFLGKNVYIPILKKKIPIIFSNSVDMSFGTGCLKVTPAHDFNDFDIGKKNCLNFINIFTKDGKLNDNVPSKYRGLSISDAKKMVVNELSADGFLFKIEEYISNVPTADRSGAVVEPFLTTQWYVNVKPLLLPVKEKILNKELSINPSKWTKVFLSWIENAKDWCISRQIWWGHRIPVWYDDKNKIYVGYNLDDVLKKYNLPNFYCLRQDEDVLDTWFSSALWPFASLGWPNILKFEYYKFYPTSVLVTGFDIIFFWVIRMLMFGIRFTGELPFKEVYVHGLIRDSYGAKMSKTKGNVIDPLDIVNGISKNDIIKKQLNSSFKRNFKEKIINNINLSYPNGIDAYGVDALRLTLISLSTGNNFLKMDIKKVLKYKNFCNKLWNAYNFVSSLFSFINKKFFYYSDLLFYDYYICCLWNKVKNYVNFYLKKNFFFKVLNILYKFLWFDFCDWYIEVVKKSVFYKKSFNYNFFSIFKEFILVLHPLAPFITEEIWENVSLNKLGEAIIQPYPSVIKFNNLLYKKTVILFKNFVRKIRKYFSYVIFENSIYICISFKNFKDLLNFEKIYFIILNLFNVNNVFLIFDSISLKSFCIIDNFYIYILNNEFVYNKNFVNSSKNLKKINNLEALLTNSDFLSKANLNVIEEKKKELLSLRKLLF